MNVKTKRVMYAAYTASALVLLTAAATRPAPPSAQAPSSADDAPAMSADASAPVPEPAPAEGQVGAPAPTEATATLEAAPAWKPAPFPGCTLEGIAKKIGYAGREKKEGCGTQYGECTRTRALRGGGSFETSSFALSGLGASLRLPNPDRAMARRIFLECTGASDYRRMGPAHRVDAAMDERRQTAWSVEADQSESYEFEFSPDNVTIAHWDGGSLNMVKLKFTAGGVELYEGGSC
jgi:hypothetical protein